MSDLPIVEKLRDDIIALYEARTSNTYGGLFDAFSADDYTALHNAGLIRSYIPAGCMAPLTKLTPRGCKVAAQLRGTRDSDPLVPRLIGRADYLTDKGEIKTPELLREAASALTRAKGTDNG